MARAALLALLQQEAAYVQSIAGEELPLLLSSGFDAVSTNRTQVPLTKPVVERIDNPMSTKLGLRLQPVPTAAAYEIRVSYGTNGWQAVGVFTQSRSILIEDLTPGTMYNVQARAVGGSTGYSDWSDPVSHMAM
ncbi:MAG: fibronectin type III domain-containing protein [Verrucomicrobiota bacterium]